MRVLSRVRLSMTPWTVARQASLPLGFPTRTLEWVAISSSRGSLDPEIEPMSLESPALQEDSAFHQITHSAKICKEFFSFHVEKVWLLSYDCGLPPIICEYKHVKIFIHLPNL